MGWKNDQFFPSAEIVTSVIDLAVLPAIEATCNQLGIAQIAAEVSVWSAAESRSEPNILVSGSTGDGARGSGRIRLRFRRTITGRVLFFAQLRMQDPGATGGFAGLIVRGQIDVGGETAHVSTTSCTGIYNRSSWIDPALV